MRTRKLILSIYLLLIARNLCAQQNSINSHIFTVTSTPDRSAVGHIDWRDLQASPYVGGWKAPSTWAANNLFWIFPTNDFEGCMTSDGSKATSWNKCAHVVMKNLDCVAASASGTHYTCSTENTFTPVTGDAVAFKADVASGASPDLNVNGAGAKPLKKSGTSTAVTTNDFSAGEWMWAIYDGTNWQVILGGGSITINGQTCTIGGSCNVNVGAAAHSIALNQGNGSAITGLLLGAHQVPVGTAASDPNAKTVPDCTDTGGNHLNFTQSTDAWSCGTSGSSSQLHVIEFGVDGCNGTSCSVVATGDINRYPSANFTCTINAAMISADQAGSITIDVWKANAAIPTSSNKISASAPVTLSSAQLNQASSLSGWTTSVSPNDVFGFNIVTSSVLTKFTAQLWCQ